jgi:RimJ/RimL family protein N-acetyltransferase
MLRSTTGLRSYCRTMAAASEPSLCGVLRHVSQSPPERLLVDRGELARLRERDGDDVAAAVHVSLAHLKPWMPWATEAAVDPGMQRSRGREAEDQWDQGSDYTYVLRPSEAGPVIGMFGLHRRIGPAALEIGYWLHPDYLGCGHASRAVAALTKVALSLPDVDRIEIHTDEVNTSSAAIPRRLGYRLDRVEPKTPQASGETHRKQIWVTP